MKCYRARLLAASLRRPDSILHWILEETRLHSNSKHRDLVRRKQDALLDAVGFVERLCDDRYLSKGQVEQLMGFYDILQNKVFALYGYDGRGRPPSIIDVDDAIALYSICRVIKPETVVETGVSDGVSSAVILVALRENGKGLLCSIDFPLVGLPRVYGMPPGWLVPDQLRVRWRLFLGPSRSLLGTILKNHGPIDLFFHDSEHSYENMYFELWSAASSSREGAVLLADDALANDALCAVADAMRVASSRVYVSRGGLGGFKIEKGRDQM